eukprot:1141012-Pelagomonas_calceolata.AAC.5
MSSGKEKPRANVWSGSLLRWEMAPGTSSCCLALTLPFHKMVSWEMEMVGKSAPAPPAAVYLLKCATLLQCTKPVWYRAAF